MGEVALNNSSNDSYTRKQKHLFLHCLVTTVSNVPTAVTFPKLPNSVEAGISNAAGTLLPEYTYPAATSGILDIGVLDGYASKFHYAKLSILFAGPIATVGESTFALDPGVGGSGTGATAGITTSGNVVCHLIPTAIGITNAATFPVTLTAAKAVLEICWE